jgi:hypothetical protein
MAINPIEAASQAAKKSPSVAPPRTVAIPPPLADNGDCLPSSDSVSFGSNVLIFDPTMSSATIQSQVDDVFQTQQSNQFGSQRYALLFQPGTYSVDVQVGFYTTVHGLGTTPDAVTITGGVNAMAAWNEDNALDNFWRGVENLAITPTIYSNNTIWATSQATWLRRVHVHGELWLFDYISPGPNNWASGGFVADSIIDIGVQSGSQQQYLTRNSQLTKWQGQLWNMVFVGDLNPPNGTWPSAPITVIPNTPVIREKPYLTVDSCGNYVVVVPSLKQGSQGPSWTTCRNTRPSTSIPLTQFYVANPNVDNAATINIALQRGLHLLLTPGVYPLSQSIVVRNANTVVLGLGLATLQPTSGTPAIIVADVDGVTIAGLLLDAGTTLSPNLLQIGGLSPGNIDHSANPTAIFDVSCRVGGAAPTAEAASCVVINSNNVLIDNIWLWRADHGPAGTNYTGWTVNPCTNGLIVNGDNVTAYGLFVEHFEGFQTLWNGNGGTVYFYQSECPYDVPNQQVWTQNGENGYPSYKVGNSVTSHAGEGIGVYCNFDNVVQLSNAIETPDASGIQMNHLVTIWLNGAAGSSINHIINGVGSAVTNNSTMSFSTN